MAKGKQMFPKSKPIFPLVQLVQGLFIMQQATGGRLDDLIYQFIDAIFGVQNAINMDWNRQKINEIIGYMANNPQKVVIDTAIAVGVTAAIRKALQYMGVPALVDVGPFYIKVR